MIGDNQCFIENQIRFYLVVNEMQQFEPIFAGDGYRPNVGIIICNTAKFQPCGGG